jgi:hypothetical protein
MRRPAKRFALAHDQLVGAGGEQASVHHLHLVAQRERTLVDAANRDVRGALLPDALEIGEHHHLGARQGTAIRAARDIWQGLDHVRSVTPNPARDLGIGAGAHHDRVRGRAGADQRRLKAGSQREGADQDGDHHRDAPAGRQRGERPLHHVSHVVNEGNGHGLS